MATHKQPNLMHFKALADKKSPRLQPPADLGAAQQQIWHQTVNALPSDWFGGEQVPILTAYCNHTARLAQLEQAIAKLADPTGDDLAVFSCLSKLASGESAKVAMHARSMRLTQQSRLKAETASSRGLGAASAGRTGADKYFDELLA
jgi:hypothetical protein